MARLLGGAIGTALSSVVILNCMTAELKAMPIDEAVRETILDDPTSVQHELRDQLSQGILNQVIEAYIESYRILWFVATACLVASLLVSFALFRKYGLKREGDDELIAEGQAWAKEQKAAKSGEKEEGVV